METITEQHWSTNKFLRFIITVPHYRPAMEPVYKIHKNTKKEYRCGKVVMCDHHEIIGQHKANYSVATRALVGFGETLEQAQVMANSKKIV